jgi:hypothetical protein
LGEVVVGCWVGGVGGGWAGGGRGGHRLCRLI